MCDRTNSSALQKTLYGKPFAGGFDGGQAEYVRTPFADVNLLKIRDAVADEKALCLSDTIPTSYHSTVCTNVQKGKSVAVWGLGQGGLFACKWSKLSDARRVIAIDSVLKRLALARDVFGCDLINFSEQSDVVEAIDDLEPEGVDCCIDATAFRYTKGWLHTAERAVGAETDSTEVANEMLRAVRKSGSCALVGGHAATTNQFLIGALMGKGITLRGTGQAPVQKYWQELLKKVEIGKFDPIIILTHRFSIEDSAQLYDVFNGKKDGIIKTFAQSRFSGCPAKGMLELSTFEAWSLKPAAAHVQVGVKISQVSYWMRG